MTGPDATKSSIPDGMRLYAIGDIHGRLDLLRSLMQMIEAHEATLPQADTLLVFLGDYIDRGPDSRGVVDFLINRIPGKFETCFLRGNHEDMMMGVFESVNIFDVWALNGGMATARSYGIEFDPHGASANDIKFMIKHLDVAVPGAHRKFFDGLRLRLEIGDYFFVHAGVRPGVPLGLQHESDCMFIRSDFLNHRGDFGKIIVHGHTPVEEPQVLPNRIALDTGAFFSGRLTALCLEGTTRKFLIADASDKRG
jgi:serine/threonine protein phosphatase 1